MTRASKSYMVILGTFILFANCRKEYSYEGGVPAIFYALHGSGPCLGVLTGTYTTGIPLNTSNTIQYQVDVSAPGSFSFQSTSMAGVQFSASGHFEDTGVQTVTLKGTGTPNAEGEFNFPAPPGLDCPFTVIVTGQQAVIADFTLTGSPNQCSSAQSNGLFQTGLSMSSENYIVLNVDVRSRGHYIIYTDTVGGIYFLAKGNFTDTGMQTVKLQASGLTNQTGQLVFTPKGDHVTGCTFTVSLESALPAGYILVSGNNICDGEAAGEYSVGSPLQASHNYMVQVYVAERGQYNIATQQVNGIYFAAKGVFPSGGSHKVTLVGYGVPTTAGNFTFTPEIVGPAPYGDSACNFTLDVK